MLSIITGRFGSKNYFGGISLALALGLGAAAGCDKLPLLAPGLSTITLATNSTVVQSNGTAQVTATILEQAGTPVQNGTTVTFTTTLGTVSPTDARTLNGVATTQFVANGQSGIAEIRASSGAAKPDTTSPLKLTVGGAAAARVFVTANPSRISSGGSSIITANVSDANGNAISGVTVAFTTDSGTVSNTVATTNSSGQAVTTLTATKDATVTATVAASGASAITPGTVKVTVTVLPTLSFGTISPSNPAAGQTVTIPITVTTTGATDNFKDVTVNFGDSSSQDLGPLSGSTSVSHAYRSDGIYTVTATGVNAAGDQTQAVTQIPVSPRSPVGISVSASPNPVVHGNPTTLTVAFDGTPPTNVSSYDWNFGNGDVRSTTGKSTQEVYAVAGTYTVTVTVRTTDGNSGNAQTQVVVN